MLNVIVHFSIMQLDTEINHLLDLMPASGRMYTKIISRTSQPKVIDYSFVRPWEKSARPVYINFELWQELSRSERDLLLLGVVSKLLKNRQFKPSLKMVIIAGGLLALVIEATQGNAFGMIASGALVTFVARRVWRRYPSSDPAQEIETDEETVATAIRRGYTGSLALRGLVGAIEKTAQLEERSLNFIEQSRIRHLTKLLRKQEAPI